MFSSNIAINLLYYSLLLFSKNVSGLKRITSPDKTSDNSFLQVKANYQTQDAQQPLVAAPPVVASTVDPEGLKKTVAANLLASQAPVLPNGPLAPADLSNLQVPAAVVVPPVPQSPVVQPPVPDNSTASKVGDAPAESNLNVILDPSLENISHVDKCVKNNMEHAVHNLKKALEEFTNLTGLLGRTEQTQTFSVDGEDYTVKAALEFLNKSLKQVETAQKVLFQANAFTLSGLTNSANGKSDDKTKNA